MQLFGIVFPRRQELQFYRISVLILIEFQHRVRRHPNWIPIPWIRKHPKGVFGNPDSGMVWNSIVWIALRDQYLEFYRNSKTINSKRLNSMQRVEFSKSNSHWIPIYVGIYIIYVHSIYILKNLSHHRPSRRPLPEHQGPHGARTRSTEFRQGGGSGWCCNFKFL